MVIERIESSRNQFINQIANWLPEYRLVNCKILTAESEGRIKFYWDDAVYFTIINAKTKKVLYRVKAK